MNKVCSVVLIPTSKCNLQCKYCYIDKDGESSLLERDLEKSFKDPNYYYNLKTQLIGDCSVEEIEFWGGEPLLQLPRTLSSVSKFIENEPRLASFKISSNFSHKNAIPSLIELFKVLSRYPQRRFFVRLQISIDGPEDITDNNRGLGVTKAVIDNMSRLGELMQYKGRNIQLLSHFKPTISAYNFESFQDFSYCLEYFKFFEDLYSLMESQGITPHPTLPSTEIPYKYTKIDGIRFAALQSNLLKLAEFKNDIKYQTRFEIYPYVKDDIEGYKCGARLCGLVNCIGLLPNNMSFICHRSIDDIRLGYENKTFIGRPHFIFTSIEEFNHEYNLIREKYQLMKEENTVDLSEFVILIRTLAALGEIEPQYNDPDEALDAAKYITRSRSKCIYAMKQTTGTINLEDIGEIRLLLNGVHKIVKQFGKGCRSC